MSPLFAVRIRNTARVETVARQLHEWDMVEEVRKDVIIMKSGISSKVFQSAMKELQIDAHDYQVVKQGKYL